MHPQHSLKAYNLASQLSVQRKFLKVIELEGKNWVLKQILQGLLVGQLSSLMRADSDTIPTPLNLRKWIIQVDPKCCVCENQPTVHHTLSNCPTALTQGRYTWRHDSALQSLTYGLKKSLPTQTKLFADLPTLTVLD